MHDLVEAPTRDEMRELVRLIGGYRISQSIYAAVALNIPDLLAEGPTNTDDLAAETGTHAGNLYRLLRLLSGAGLLVETAPRRFALTRLGAGLRIDVPGSPGALARLTLQKSHWEPWGHLLDSVRTGDTAFEQVHGVGLFAYLERHPDEGRVFDAAMTENIARDGIALAENYDFSNSGTVIDVGGGQGLLIASVLRANPELRGVLFDLPELIARGSPMLKELGVADRCTTVGGSFFDAVPARGDAYVLRHIIHDWDDERASLILRNCADAAARGGKVLVIERLIDPDHRRGLALLSNDMEMMVNLGGRERSECEFRALFAQAGLRVARIIGPLDTGAHVIIEGVRG